MSAKTQEKSRAPSLARSIAFNLVAGSGLALGIVAWLVSAAAPETAALVDDNAAPVTTLLIVAGSLALYLAFGMTLTGLLFDLASES